MNTTKTVVQEAQKVSPNLAGNMPEKKFRAGGVSATVWLNKGHASNGLIFRILSIAGMALI